MQIPLHIKTTVLASVVIIFVMGISLAFFGTVVLDRIQNEQRNFAEAQAEKLAEKITDTMPLNDYEQVGKLVEIFDKARIGRGEENSIRIWENQGSTMVKRVGTENENTNIEIPRDSIATLYKGKEAQFEEVISNQSVYRVFVPILFRNQLIGAVEFTERLDSFSSLINRYLLTGVMLAFSFIALSAFSIYILTRYFVYRPLHKITVAMNLAKSGDLEARATIGGRDEFGTLGTELNRMLTEIEEFTKERDLQNERLAEKVSGATTELEKRNKQLERANAEIWEATSRLSELEKLAAAGETAAQFAHEVGTPLNLISGHVQLLQKQVDGDESAQKRLDVIGSQIERIEGIVRTMLDKTRFGDVEFGILSLSNVLTNVAEIVGPKLQKESIRMTLDLDEKLPEINGNSERLQQVFLNLINNAADAMPNGGELNIKTKSVGDQVFAEISDTGLGMEEETRKRIFEPLFTTKTRGRGTGLGLVVVRQILVEHHANISVESEINNGTSFKITFPIT